MPLNAFDANYQSFEKEVLPELQRRGIAALGMKPFSGTGDAVKKGVVSAEEALRSAMSLPVSTTITGMDKPEVLEQNLKIAQGFQPMPASEMDALRNRCHFAAGDGRFELYKVSLKFDNPEARLAREFPIDMQVDRWVLVPREADKARLTVFLSLHQRLGCPVRRENQVEVVLIDHFVDLPNVDVIPLESGAVQMPLNCMDSSFRSFEEQVLPELNRRGIAPLGMKSLGGSGEMVAKGAITAEEGLRYAMSLPVATTISGIDSLEVLQQNLEVALNFKPMSLEEMEALRKRCRRYSGDGRFELFKTTKKYDGNTGREQHGLPSSELLPA
jgi:hypothetical protein